MDRKYAERLLKKTAQDYNQIADVYSKARPQPWKEMEFLGKDFLENEDRILDLGCGSGRFSETMKEKNMMGKPINSKKYVGVDNSEKFIEIAKKRYPNLKFLLAEAENLPFPENYFDKVYAIALFHHLPSKEYRIQVLKEIKRVLKKGGLLILTVWNLWQKRKTKKLIFKHALLKILGKSKLDFKDILMDWGGEKNIFFHCFTKKELENLVKKTNFKIFRKGEILVGREAKIRSKLPNSNFYLIAQKPL